MLHGVSVFTVAAVLLLILLSATGLASVWVALGRGHWFVRMLGLAAWLGMWLLVPAYEITAILFFESLVVVPPLLWAHQLRARAPGGPLVQFTLRDLMLFVVVVALVAAAGTAAPRSVWTSCEVFVSLLGLSPEIPSWLVFVFFGTFHGLFVLLGTWIALGRARLFVRILILLVTLLGFSLLLVVGALPDGTASGAERMLQPEEWSMMVLTFFMVLVFTIVWITLRQRRLVVRLCTLFVSILSLLMTSILGALAGLVAWTPQRVLSVGFERWIVIVLTFLLVLPLPVVFLSAFRMMWPVMDSTCGATGARRGTTRWIAGILVCVLIAGLLAPSLGFFYLLMTTPPIPEEPLPEPNGFNTFIRVGKFLENVSVPQEDDSLPLQQQPGPDDYRAFRMQHGAILSEARAALDIPCRVPVKYDAEYFEMTQSPNQDALRQLAWALVAEGRSVSVDGNDVAAAEFYFDVVRLGRRAGRGGLYLDWCVGVAVERIGLWALHDARELLPGPVRRDVRRRLLDPKERREPLEPCQRRDRIWEANAYGWPGRLACVIQEYNREAAMRNMLDELPERQVDALCQILLAEMALADYRDEHGAYPTTLDALAPAYLDEVPKDLFGTGPLVYRTTDQGYELYSVGDNGQDDGRKSVFEAGDTTGDDVWFWK